MERIEDFAFSRCTSLTEIKIPKRVCHTGYGIFSLCSALNQQIFNCRKQCIIYKKQKKIAPLYKQNLF